MALSLRISFNHNPQRPIYYRVLLSVALTVGILYWLGALLALTLGSSMCGEFWASYW